MFSSCWLLWLKEGSWVLLPVVENSSGLAKDLPAPYQASFFDVIRNGIFLEEHFLFPPLTWRPVIIPFLFKFLLPIL